MELQFYGAVRSVTGSMHMLRANGHSVLLECGMYQGKRAEANDRNRHLPFDASKVDACTLSHAHIDHSGNLPNLVKSGYDGRIVTTEATADLAKVLLQDSAHIQEKDAEYLNRKSHQGNNKGNNKGKHKHKHKHKTTPVEPIYTREDASEAAARFDAVPYHEWVEVCPGVRVTFYDAGHILGSGVELYEIEEGGRTVRLGFTGDLGRPRHPILRDPQPLPRIDYLITESTYGNRVHEGTEHMKEKLLQTVSATFERGGRLIIPAFSVGRTQNLCYYLSELFLEDLLPRVKIFVDSPLAIDATKAYRDHSECYDAETLELIREGGKPFGFDQLTYTRSVEESMALNDLDEPCVVIAASGMCEGGRILHHLKHGVGKRENTVLIVGFQAHHTLGRRLVEKVPQVRIYGQEYAVRCEVKTMNGFSAHADRDELRTYIKHIPGLKQVYVVHGEEEASFAFAHYLMQIGIKAHVPTFKEVVEL